MNGPDPRDGCAHYYADPSGGFGWPACVKCGAPVPTDDARYRVRACCRTTEDGDHVPTCASLDARRRRAGRVPR